MLSYQFLQKSFKVIYATNRFLSFNTFILSTVHTSLICAYCKAKRSLKPLPIGSSRVNVWKSTNCQLLSDGNFSDLLSPMTCSVGHFDNLITTNSLHNLEFCSEKKAFLNKA